MISLKLLLNKNVSVYPIKYDEEIKNDFGKTQPIYFDSVPSFGSERTTFAYLGIPNGEKPSHGYPAVVLVHGGGGCAYFEWVEYWNSKGYVAIAFDCVGRQFGGLKIIRTDPDSDGTKAERNPKGRTVLPDDSGSFSNKKSNRFDSWTYYNEANIVLAHNIILAMDCVDKSNTFITGISWGGVLTAISSGIDDRFCAFAPVYGTGHLLESPIFHDKKTKMNESTEIWEKYFDPKSFVSMNKRPIMFTLGTDDRAFSVEGAQKTYGCSKGKTIYSYRLNLPHHHRWRDDEDMIHIVRFFDSFAKGIDLPFEVTEEIIKDGKVEIAVNEPKALKEIHFNYTEGKGRNSVDWEWNRVDVVINNNRVSSKIPPNARYCFYELLGMVDNFVLSSSIFNIQK